MIRVGHKTEYAKMIYSLILAVSLLTLTSCDNETERVSTIVEESQIVEEDDVLLENESEEEKKEEVPDSFVSKTSNKLDINELDPEINRMLELCDVLNMVQVEGGKIYDTFDGNFVWRSINVAIGCCDWEKEKIESFGDYIYADADLVREYGYGMFGKLNELPEIPQDMLYSGECGFSGTTDSNDIKYKFSIGDRGLSESRIVAATAYSDASLELQVELVDISTGDEIANFIYSMRTNTKNTSMSARFGYEITGVRVGDSKTAGVMEGVPRIAMSSQVYGIDLYEKDDPMYLAVEEIPFFATTNTTNKEIENINACISDEIASIPDSTDQYQWYEIKTYPVTNSRYVQAVCSYCYYPCYGTMGDVKSYNYSIRAGKRINTDDAFELAKTDEGKLIDSIKASLKENDGSKLLDDEVQGFVILDDDSVMFFVKLFFEGGEAGGYDTIVSYNCGTDTLGEFEEDIVPREFEDTMTPPLTHGR